jgi:antitoxin component of MazEF toxin-antitoxin module
MARVKNIIMARDRNIWSLGGSYVISLPRIVLDNLGVDEGDKLDIFMNEKGQIVLKKARQGVPYEHEES